MENGVSHDVSRVTQGRVPRTRGWVTLPRSLGGARDSDRWHVLVRLRETKGDAAGVLLLLLFRARCFGVCRSPCLSVCVCVYARRSRQRLYLGGAIRLLTSAGGPRVSPRDWAGAHAQRRSAPPTLAGQ